jgi:hypothetical protein
VSHCEAEGNGVITNIVLESANEVVSASLVAGSGLD